MSGLPIVNGEEVVIPPPEGYVVDFDNPTRDMKNVYASIIIFSIEWVIGAMFFAQRIYTNGVLLKKMRIDDWLFIATFLLSTSSQACVVYLYAEGLLGVHAFEMPVDKHDHFSLMLSVSTLQYIPTTILAKVVLCFFYYRLSPAPWYRYSVWVTGIICAGSLIGIWWAVLFSCNPIAASWDTKVLLDPETTCIDRPPIYITQAAFGSVTDLLLLVLPIPTLIGLQLNRRKKLGLIGLFSIGSITLITSIVRLVLLLPAVRNPDQPMSLSGGCIWVIIEANLLIMCCSLPTLRIFLSKVFPNMLGDSTTAKSSDNYQKGSYNLRTFGAGDGKRKFDTLVELEHDVHFSKDKSSQSQLRPDDDNKNQTQVYSHRDPRASSDGTGATIHDTGSEEGIIQTRTTTVSYAQR